MQAIGSESAPHPNSLAGEDSNKEMMTAQLQDLYQKDKAPGKDIESNNNPMITSPDRPSKFDCIVKFEISCFMH